MQHYRCKIRTMNELQKAELEHLCSTLGIDAEITPIKPVGQPSKIDFALFYVHYENYILGKTSPEEIMLKFDLSKAGFYKRLKQLNLPTKKVYNEEQLSNKQLITSEPQVQSVEDIDIPMSDIWAEYLKTCNSKIDNLTYEFDLILEETPASSTEVQSEEVSNWDGEFDLESEDYGIDLEDYGLELEDNI